MAEMILRATGSKLKIISEIHVTSTQAQYDTCLFEFDEAWDGYGLRTAVFYSNPNNIKAMLLDTQNRCYIPWDSFSHSRYLYIGAYGSNGNSYLPTQFVEVMYQPGANIDDHLYPPTPGIYEQIAAGLSQIHASINTKASQASVDAALIQLSNKADISTVNGVSAQVEGLIDTKADKAEVDALADQVDGLASGSPKGVYATLASLQTDKPTGDTGIYIVSADGNWYYWDGSAWTSGGVYQSTGIPDGSVTPKKTSFLKAGRNLFNQATVIQDANLTLAGNTQALAGYNVSDWIPVTAGMLYSTTPVRRYCLYDTGKAFLSFQDAPGYTAQSINPAQTGYLRVSVKTADLGRTMVQEGALTEYEPFGVAYMEDIIVTEENLDASTQQLLDPLKPTLWASKNLNTYKIKFRYSSTENMVIEFAPLGVNAIIHPLRIYRETAERLTGDMDTPVLWYTLSTDWISPYNGIIASEGTLTDFTGTVGGNHGTDGGAGFATARNLSSAMYVDDVEVSDGALVSGKKVVLRVDNYISASNKVNPDTGEKADSLWEKVIYTMTQISGGGLSMETMVYLTAREPITIMGYVGFQMTTNMMVGNVYFNDSANKYTPDGVQHNSLALPFAGERFVYSNATDVIAVYTNRGVGLGKLSNIGSRPVHFISPNNKIYSHLVASTNPLTLAGSDTAVYSGGYTFMPPLACSGAERAYIIRENGETHYCVDFLASYARSYLELPQACMGRQIEIISKTESVTCDDIVGPRGLKIRATGWGSIRVRIKGAS